ncbi:uncharacterized protein BDZ99DRAFT_348838, partial [Mytilinidion resinicola]
FYLPARLAFNTLAVFLQRVGDENVLPHIHVMLIFVEALSKISCLKPLLAVPWQKVVDFLNTLAGKSKGSTLHQNSEFPHSRTNGTEHCPEDFLIRRQIWAQLYWPTGWFDEVKTDLDERLFTHLSARKLRVDRILWLGVRIA